MKNSTTIKFSPLLKLFTAFFLFLFLAGFAEQVFCSQIPEKELAIFKQNFPQLKVRFDALVELPDGTLYVPVYPLKSEFPKEEVKVTKVLPAGKQLKDRPDFFMYNTNFAFFKIITKPNQAPTLLSSDQIPSEVKMGMLPQDLLVPTGLKIPSDLRIILGDLIISIAPSDEFKETNIVTNKPVTSKRSSQNTADTQPVSSIKELANKNFYSTSFDKNTLTVLNTANGKAFREIAFRSIPSDVKIMHSGQYILLTTMSTDSLFIIDSEKAKVIKEIKVGKKPFSIAIADRQNKAFIANKDDGTISIIDLTKMEVQETIKVTGNPSYLAVSPDQTKLYYLDSTAGSVYQIVKAEDYFEGYKCINLFTSSNIQKIIVEEDKIITLNRGQNEVEVFYFKPQKELTLKPSDELVEISTHKQTDKTVKPSDEEKIQATKTEKTKAAPSKDAPKTDIQAGKNIEAKVTKILEEKSNETSQGVTEADPIKEISNIQEVTPAPAKKYNSDKKKKEPKEATVQKTKEEIAAEKEEEQRRVDIVSRDYNPVNPDLVNIGSNTSGAGPKQDTSSTKTADYSQVQFIKVSEKSNDFAVYQEKLYTINPHEYTVNIYNIKSGDLIKTIPLDKKGFYNSIKINPDIKFGMITNISSKELNIIDVQKDTIITKLPLLINVHHVLVVDKAPKYGKDL
ncbi:MAG: YncE family protein [Candidatus Gastranaerophilales bacterium]|nr:YncE family protein [Candidatus Gastranaerophilales bacterium]